MKYRYYLRNRPPSVGTHPEKPVDKETWYPARRIPEQPEGSDFHAYGWVEYDVPLTLEAIDKYELFPQSEEEQAEYAFYREDPNMRDWLRKDYLDTPDHVLQARMNSVSPFDLGRAAMILKKAGAK